MNHEQLSPEVELEKEPTPAEMTQDMLKLFGREALALMTLSDLEDSNNSKKVDIRQLSKWARGEEVPNTHALWRLKNVYDLSNLLLETQTEQTVRSWFVGLKYDLGDKSPMRVIGSRPLAVREEAEAFIQGDS